MSDLSLDFDATLLGQPGYGDLLIRNGDLVLTSDVDATGTDATLQLVTQRLRFFLGDYFLALDSGVPWFQQILVKQADPSIVDGLLRDCILGTPGVVALTAYQSERNLAQRRYSVSFTILTATGSSIAARVPISVAGSNP